MKRLQGRKRRHALIRKKVFGTPERPRLCVFRSHKNLYAQLIDDTKAHTLFALSTNAAEFRKRAGGGNVKAAEILGAEFAKKSKEKGYGRVVFDRAGYLYHGRVKAFAEACRKNGLVF